VCAFRHAQCSGEPKGRHANVAGCRRLLHGRISIGPTVGA
jgi:hypothetical protein